MVTRPTKTTREMRQNHHQRRQQQALLLPQGRTFPNRQVPTPRRTRSSKRSSPRACLLGGPRSSDARVGSRLSSSPCSTGPRTPATTGHQYTTARSGLPTPAPGPPIPGPAATNPEPPTAIGPQSPAAFGPKILSATFNSSGHRYFNTSSHRSMVPQVPETICRLFWFYARMEVYSSILLSRTMSAFFG